MSGKWSQAGVPHKGWTCVDVYDLGEPDLTCEMCDSAQVRYIHMMRHPDFPEMLAVGCVCAGRMEEDYEGARQREADFKRRLRKRVVSEAAQSWIRAADEILVKGGLSGREEEFVSDMRRRAGYARYYFSEKQMCWFKAIYLRVVGRADARPNP